MKDAGILDGDYVTVRRQETASDGEIVVALVGEEATVKRFFKEEDHIRLQPENDAHEPIRTRDAQVIGKVVGVLQEGVMSTALLEPPVRREHGHGVTLEEVLTQAFEGTAGRVPSAAARCSTP